MPNRNITFRSHLQGSVIDFCEASGLGSLAKASVVVDLVVALARYAEEGRRLYPDVYLFGSLQDAIRLLPGSEVLVVGECDVGSDFVKQTLKRCAPLAFGGWKVFMELRAERIRYGLFHGDLNPLAVSIEDTLFSFQGQGPAVVRINQLGDDCVEIRNSSGHRHNVFLSNKRETDPAPNRYLAALSGAICMDVDPGIRETVTTYVTRSVHEALRDSHGSLVAVTRGRSVPAFLKDGVPVSPPIRLADQVKACLDGTRNDAELRAISTLISGMFCSDGIVLFSSRGLVLAYNCFVKQSKKAAASTSVGGARRRAFETLCARLGRGISAAYIQSQDGWTDFQEHA